MSQISGRPQLSDGGDCCLSFELEAKLYDFWTPESFGACGGDVVTKLSCQSMHMIKELLCRACTKLPSNVPAPSSEWPINVGRTKSARNYESINTKEPAVAHAGHTCSKQFPRESRRHHATLCWTPQG